MFFINFIGTMNRIIDYLNEADEEDLPADVAVFDVKVKMIALKLERIAERALKIGDEIILEELRLLGIVTQEHIANSKPSLVPGDSL